MATKKHIPAKSGKAAPKKAAKPIKKAAPAKKSVKPAAKAGAKPAHKAGGKPVAKTSKPAPKKSGKPIPKKAAKPMPKPTPKVIAKPIAKVVAKPAPKKSASWGLPWVLRSAAKARQALTPSSVDRELPPQLVVLEGGRISHHGLQLGGQTGPVESLEHITGDEIRSPPGRIAGRHAESDQVFGVH